MFKLFKIVFVLFSLLFFVKKKIYINRKFIVYIIYVVFRYVFVLNKFFRFLFFYIKVEKILFMYMIFDVFFIFCSCKLFIVLFYWDE